MVSGRSDFDRYPTRPDQTGSISGIHLGLVAVFPGKWETNVSLSEIPGKVLVCNFVTENVTIQSVIYLLNFKQNNYLIQTAALACDARLTAVD